MVNVLHDALHVKLVITWNAGMNMVDVHNLGALAALRRVNGDE
jgi:hypothetical protein